MRLFSILAVILVSCAPLQPGEVRVFGRIHSVSPSDIEAAIAVDQRDRIGPPPIHHVEVISRDEISHLRYDTWRRGGL